jgi:hypothetical protein
MDAYELKAEHTSKISFMLSKNKINFCSSPLSSFEAFYFALLAIAFQRVIYRIAHVLALALSEC